MDNKAIESLAWVLVYAGMLVFGLGVWLLEHSLAIGSTLMLFGAAGVGSGVVLIWVRSRRP